MREDIGEKENLAAAHPDKVTRLDQLIEDYIAEANVVVPLPNPKFEPAEFDPSQIGVQPGGLKMPPAFRASQQQTDTRKPARPVNQKSLLGWVAKNARATVEQDALQISPAGRQPFIANAKVRANGSVQVRLRIRTQKDGVCRLQWRTEGQDTFPDAGQRQSFDVAGGEWRELSVPLDVKGRLVHVRLFLSDAKRPTEIDWMEVESNEGSLKEQLRWDFRAPAGSPAGSP